MLRVERSILSAASAPSGRRRNSKGKGSKALEEVAGEAVVAVEAEEGVEVGVVAEVGASVAAVEVEAAAAVAVAEGIGVVAEEAAAEEVELVEAELHSGDPSTSHALVGSSYL
ncbi:unnamed protein product [Closterium sp. Naga37s-1]|nr:unnamed protein product [Closterium sp. Naga37s-1]